MLNWWIVAAVMFLVATMTVVASVLRVVLSRSSGITPGESFRPDRYDLNNLMTRLGMTEEDVRNFTAPVYREVRIPKRTGGTRLLEIPDRQTLALQRRILRRLLTRLKAHQCAVGFEQGLSIVDAARPHTGKEVVIRIDIRRFFESTSSDRVMEWLRSIGWDAPSAEFLTAIVTWQGHLPQGAPTSPRLSNLVNARLDAALEELAGRFNGDYTRYADDITLSFNTRSGRKVRGIIQVVRRLLKQAGYQMHGKKTRVLRKHQRQIVLGLTVNEKVSVPRHIRRRLRAIRHHVSAGRSATMSAAQLQGWTSYESMVEQNSSEL